MLEFELVKMWVETNEAFLSGVAAATFLVTLVAAPLLSTTRALRQRSEPDRDDAVVELTAAQILERPAVAVLPFANQSDDADQAYFASGITEDLTTALSSFRCFPVIGRSSVAAVTRDETDVRRVAECLGARYVIQGAVRRHGEQVRITVQLVDAESGHTLWAQTFDRTFAGVFTLQDEITHAIVAAIEPRLESAEERRALAIPDEKLDAWDCSLKALWHVRKGTRGDYEQAHRLLEWALVRDPLSSHAHSVLALCQFQEALHGWTEDPARALAGTLRAAQAAVALDDQDWLAHSLLGIASLWTLGDHDRALQEQDRALELNPSSAISHQLRACVLLFAGRPEEAVASLDLVMRLEPRYQSRSMVLADLSLNHLLMGHVEQAVDHARRALVEDADNVRAHQRLVSALARQGDAAATEAALKDLLALQPDLTIGRLAPTYPFIRPEDRSKFVQGLEAAGLPS